MTKLVNFLGRKAASRAEKPTAPAQPAKTMPQPGKPASSAKGEIELDQDLFFPIATQLGQENEAVRNLLIDAEHKIGELEIIKRSIGKLVDPVSKTLRDYEETKNEKLSLQNILNSTRLSHNKLRDDLTAAQKRASTYEAECTRLRDVLTVAQQSVAALEQAKSDHVAELTARRTHIAELQRLVQSQGTDLQLTREENRKLGERIASADRKMVQLESAASAAQQQAMQAAQERTAVQAALDKALGDYSQTARRLGETERTLATALARLKVAETGLVEAQAERTRLAAALDEANQKHIDEVNLRNTRFDALQARAVLTERLLEESRETLMARADEIRSFERQALESSTAKDNAGEKLGQIETALAERDRRIRELEETQASLSDQNDSLAHAVHARESAYNRAQQKILEQEELVQLLEGQIKAARDANDLQIDQLTAELQREKLERSMAEGALESGRKDIARLLREISAVHQKPTDTASEIGAEQERQEQERQVQDRLRSAA
jgi:crescentin